MNPLLTNQYAHTRYSERLARGARHHTAFRDGTEPGFVLISRSAVRRPRWWSALESGQTVRELHMGGRTMSPVAVHDDDEAECAAC